MSGWGIYQFLSALYDYPFWAYIQFKFGIWGSVGLSVGALVINLILLHWYVRRGVDWLGVGILEEIKKNAEIWIDKMLHNAHVVTNVVMYLPAKLFALIIRALNKNDILAFFFLSIWQDPFITTSFLRHGNTDTKVSRKDYFVMVGSTIVTSIFWSLIMGVIIQFFIVLMN